MSLRRGVLNLALFLSIQGVPLFGQFESGAILGTVRDPSGSSVPVLLSLSRTSRKGVKLRATTDTSR